MTIIKAVLMHTGITDNLFDQVLTALCGPKVSLILLRKKTVVFQATHSKKKKKNLKSQK